MSQGKKTEGPDFIDPASIPTRITKPEISTQGRTLEEPLPEDFANPTRREHSQAALLPLSTDAAKLMPLVEEQKKPERPIERASEKTIDKPPKEHLPLLERPRFELGPELSQETRGKLFLAHDKNFSRDVFLWEALRGVSPDAFFREPRITAKLQHPGVLPVYDIGRWTSGDFVYTTGSFSGQPLDSLLITAKQPSARISFLPCVISAARVIAYAHEKKLCHLNLSPKSVLVSPSRQVVVTHWRYAQQSDAKINASEAVPVTEDPEFRPPEQLASDTASATIDVYSIGALLYWLVSASTPSIKNGLVVPLEDLAPWAPKALSKIANKALSQLPEQRYASAKELLADLESFESTQLTNAIIPGSAARFIKALKERALLVLFAVAVTAGLILMRSSLSDEKRKAADAATNASAAIDSAKKSQQSAEERTATLLLRFAHGALERDPTEAIVWLKSLPEAQSASAAARLITSDATERGVAQRILRGHQTPITRLAVSPDKKLLASASEDSTVRIWSTDTGESTSLQGHTDTVSAISFSPDGSFVASTSKDKTARVFSTKGDAGQALPLEGAGTDISFSPDGTLLAVSDSAGYLYLWDSSCIMPGQPAPCAARQKWRRHDGDIFVLKFSSDGQQIFSGGKDKKIQLSPIDGSEPTTFSGHTGAIWDLELSPDQSKIISAGSDGSIRIWTKSDPKKKPDILAGHNDPIADLALSPDGKLLASASFDDSIKLWQWEETKKRPRVFKGHKDRVYRVAFSPNGTELASASKDGTARRWDLSCISTSDDEAEGACGPLQALRGHGDALSDVVFYGDGRLASASKDATIRLWMLSPSMSLVWRGHDSDVTGIALSPDQKLLASVGADKTVRLWDNGKPKTLGTHKKAVSQLAYSPDGKRLATASKEELKLWDIVGGEALVFSGHTDDIMALAYSPDGKRLATASRDKTIKVWDVPGGAAQTWSGHTDEVTALAFSPDGKWLVSGSKDKSIVLWDEVGTQKTIMTSKDTITGVQFSPDGRLIAAASKDKSIYLWDIQGQTSLTLGGHLGAVLDLAFSPDGKTLASGSADKTIRVWELSTDTSRVFEGHLDDVVQVVFSKDGEYLLSASRDKTARRWEVRTGLNQITGMYKKEVVGVASVGDSMFFSASRDGTIKALRDELPRGIKDLQAYLQTLVLVGDASF